MASSTKINDGNIEFKSNDFSFSINLKELFDGMTDEDRREVAKSLTWDHIFREAIERMAGESDNYCWPTDREMALDYMKIRDNLGRGLWSLISELRSEAKNRAHHEELYWRLYRLGDSSPADSEMAILGRQIRDWMRGQGITSNYTDQPAAFVDFEKAIHERFKAAIEAINASVAITK
jgi:hypothetical protein